MTNEEIVKILIEKGGPGSGPHPGGGGGKGGKKETAAGTHIRYDLHHSGGRVTSHRAFDPHQSGAARTIADHAIREGAKAKITGVKMPSGAWSSHPAILAAHQKDV